MAIDRHRLIAAREALGLTVPELAHRMSVASEDVIVQPGEIYSVENGKRNAGPKLLARYVRVEAISRDEFTAHMLGDVA